MQFDLFDPIDDAPGSPSPPDGPPWDPALTRRTRVLLHALPILNLKLADAKRDPEFHHYDSLALAMKSLDLIIENTGLDAEIDAAGLVARLSPLLTAMDAARGLDPDPDRHEAMVEKLLAALRNEGHNRRPFSVPYQDFDAEGGAVRRVLEFRILEDVFHPRGGTVLRLSNEAVNLFLNALELDIEDAQAAAEAVVHSQLARGKFNEAVQSAKTANWHSIRYAEKIDRLLRATRRDLEGVDWREAAPRLLEEAMAHIRGRLDIEDHIIGSAEDRLDVLAEADDQRESVARILSLVRSCRMRHLSVQGQLISARQVFLEEQVRQAFIPRALVGRPDLLTGVLEPMLAMGRETAQAVTEERFGAFAGAAPPPVFSLADQIGWGLQPRRPATRGTVAVEEPDLTVLGPELRRFDPDEVDRAQNRLAALDRPTPLSDLLAAADADGEPTAVRELLGLMVLRRFDPESEALPAFGAAALPGGPLAMPPFYGDDLLVTPERSGDGPSQ
jgi:hypothetical protein